MSTELRGQWEVSAGMRLSAYSKTEIPHIHVRNKMVTEIKVVSVLRISL